MIALILSAALAGCSVTDGDTIRCGDERIRLLGIDAPEMGRCRRGRVCAPGSGPDSRENLRRLVAGGRLQIERVGRDRYNRTLATVTVGGRDLSCAQLAGGYAIYRRDWDNGRRVAARCPERVR